MIFATRPPKAFTFVELILVVVILSVFSSLALPRFGHFLARVELTEFTRDLAYLARYLQAEATSGSRVYSLVFDRDRAFFCGRVKRDDGFADISGRWGKQLLVPPGITVTGEPTDFTDIFFYPDGSADTVTIICENKYGQRVSLSIQGAIGQIKVI